MRHKLDAARERIAALERERDAIISEHKFLNDLKNERTRERDELSAQNARLREAAENLILMWQPGKYADRGGSLLERVAALEAALAESPAASLAAIREQAMVDGAEAMHAYLADPSLPDECGKAALVYINAKEVVRRALDLTALGGETPNA